MRQISVLSNVILGFSLFVLLSYCSKNEELGIDFFQEESFVITQEQSLELAVSTLFFDSLTTTNSDRLIVGYHQDEYLGEIEASAFFQLLPEESETWAKDYRYDSLTMVLYYDGYYFYDTLHPITLSLHRLTEDIELDEDTDELYNASGFAYAPDALATITVYPHPLRGDSLEIRLPDALGQEFFEKIDAEEDVLLDSDDFLEYFKGIVLVAAQQSGPVIGFTRDSKMKLHYSDLSVLPVQHYIRNFSMENGLNFNRISSNRSGTLLEGLDEENPISAKNANDLAFIQGGTGIVTRIDLANLLEFQETQTDEIILARAELTFYPQVSTPEERERLPESLKISWVDEDNTSIYENAVASLIPDLEFGRDTRYVVDVTDFVYNEFNNDPLNSNGLAIFFDDFENSLDRIVIGPRADGKNTELILFILDIKDN